MKIDITIDEVADLAKQFGRGRPKRETCDQEILMTHTAYEALWYELSSHEPEFGVFLLGPTGHRAVTHVIPDTTGEGTPTQFRIGAKRLNEVLRKYAPLLEGKGFGHSHPPRCEQLSRGDLDYVRSLFANPQNDSEEILMPIMSGNKLLPFVVRRNRPDAPLAAELKLF
jgi:hypothetical protein